MTVIKMNTPKMSERVSAARFDCIDIPELIGLCRGVLADGTISLEEAEFIQDWLQQRRDVLRTWPASELHELLVKVLDDGVLTAQEELELRDLLEEIIGEPVTICLY